jgi:alpha-N-arabinofuranosidase
MPTGKITVCLDEPIGLIRPELYGQFAEHLGACVDGGLWVGEESAIPNLGGLRRDVIDALRKIHVPVLRWPGGCFADDYHWEDGIGPRRDRPRRVNLWWGQGVEDNQFGTHEFMQLCRYLGAEPYVAGNLGSGSVRELRDWVEYCNYPGDSTLARRRAANGSPQPFGVRYWGVGNENWGCGGNFCPEDYAGQYKRYATYLRDLGQTPLFLIACGPDGNNAQWTQRFFTKLGPLRSAALHGYAAHYYCGAAGTDTQYTTDQWYELLEKATRMESLVQEQRALLDPFDPERKIGLIVDEWGTWHPPTPGRHPQHLWQQNTLRDALVAALTLDIFNRNSDKLVMANIAQMVNVLQAMVLTQGDKMVTTPTYHVYDLYQSHQGGRSVRTVFETPDVSFAVAGERRRLSGLSGSASVKNGELTLSVVNPHAALPADAAIALRGNSGRQATRSVLTHEELTAHNSFDHADAVRPRMEQIEIDSTEWRQTFPPASVTVLRVPLLR